jgi:hypothetical protein
MPAAARFSKMPGVAVPQPERGADPLGFWTDGIFRARKVARFLDFTARDLKKISALIAARTGHLGERNLPGQDSVLQTLAVSCSRVAQYFEGNAAKTQLWFRLDNPMLGNVSPRTLILTGRAERLQQLIEDALAESSPTPAESLR